MDHELSAGSIASPSLGSVVGVSRLFDAMVMRGDG